MSRWPPRPVPTLIGDSAEWACAHSRMYSRPDRSHHLEHAGSAEVPMGSVTAKIGGVAPVDPGRGGNRGTNDSGAVSPHDLRSPWGPARCPGPRGPAPS